MLAAKFQRISGKRSEDEMTVEPVVKTLIFNTRTHAEMVAADFILGIDGWKMVGIPHGVEEDYSNPYYPPMSLP